MADDRVLVVADDSDVVTEFFLTTCLQQPSEYNVWAAAFIARMASKHSGYIPLITGSTAELYILPMLRCFSDVDVMFHWSSVLAIPADYPPPTRLPAEFHSRIIVCEIVDSAFPGYVFLKFRYMLQERIEDSKYHAKYIVGDWYVLNNDICNDRNLEFHGPARTFQRDGFVSPIDSVSCVRCLLWPSQAVDWPTRPRNHGWPDSATVARVVRDGCDVVRVAHRMCRQHIWLSKLQFRLSFSRAEFTLLNSWMPVQQIVYHMLRFFVKNEKLLTSVTEDTGSKEFSNYHIKTLMLWACEQETRNSWIIDVNVVRICAKLLRSVSVWLTNARCPHYFISNCNLFDSSFNLEIIANHLIPVTESWLSTWFINNYIRKCAQFCPSHISRLFNDVGSSMKLENAVSAVVNWRLNIVTNDLCSVFSFASWVIPECLSRCTATALSCACTMKNLAKIDSRLSVFFTAFVFLHVAYRLSKHGFSDELMDVLATTVGQNVGPRRYGNQSRSLLSLSEAATLMKVIANNSRSTVQLIEIELSKAYLCRALRCKDSGSDSPYHLSKIYLAVLYYTTGQYQTAIDHCLPVTRSQDHSQCSSHVVQGELLPRIDDNTDNVLGLVVFYQYIYTAALKQQQECDVNVFTAEMFAHYLHIGSLRMSLTKCCQFTRMLSTEQIERYKNYVIDIQQPLHTADLLLFKTVNNLITGESVTEHRKTTANTPIMEVNTPELSELLVKSAVEHLKIFEQLTAREFQSIATIVTTDFEALYAYKHGDYQYCLQLSTENVCKLQDGIGVSLISTFPEFIQLLDDDIVSLIAVTFIINPECRSCSFYTSIRQLILSLYMIAQCQLKLRHSPIQLTQTLDYIEVGRRRCPSDLTFCHLILKLIKRKLMSHLLKIL